MKSKKELKDAYKERKSDAGVFQIKNIKDGKVLIEGSSDIQSKWNRHRTELRFGSHRNKRLQQDWNLHGEDQFIFSVLSKLEYKDDDTSDLNSEVNILRDIVEEDLSIPDEMRY